MRGGKGRGGLTFPRGGSTWRRGGDFGCYVDMRETVKQMEMRGENGELRGRRIDSGQFVCQSVG